jgi:hypothetical protein
LLEHDTLGAAEIHACFDLAACAGDASSSN